MISSPINIIKSYATYSKVDIKRHFTNFEQGQNYLPKISALNTKNSTFDFNDQMDLLDWPQSA